MPPPLIDVGGTVVDFVLGIYSMCALLDTGAVRCWGSWADGILGYGNNQSIGNEPGEMPPADLELGGPVNQISHGHSPEHLCAVLFDNTVRCWGNGEYGALGYGNTQDIGDQPGEMPPPPVPVF